ncbi:MarR family transcriptional regulator [Agrobacterium tumefaciens]|uniref:MarR family winged helix-turn-helix transcriptional regulator n=1 Tax=Agrobacterium tumefaciens TaxID=358 RepID=UPI00287D5F92|nr:MarR family transcriptional regulator [Agrobacterium tumefaciens]MDS7595783.1 MarR family transcriptional regulator [Agrobacterium tumefaciens]
MEFSRDESIIYLATKMAREFTMALQKRASALGFSPGQFPILIELWHEEGLTQRQLLDRIDIEQATLANTLSRMERDGLIARKPHPTDRRAQIITLTPRGKELEANAIAATRGTEDALLSDFRQFERQLLAEYMRRAISCAKTARQD